MKSFLLGLVIVLTGLIVPSIYIVKSIQFKQNCSGYLKQAADANSVELALDRLNLAIDYAEHNHLTEGYTSVLYNTEDENIEYWYTNLKTCQKELQEGLDGTQLEKTNLLMKIRESLTDVDEDGTTLTIPSGLFMYPHNLLFGILLLISFILLSIGIVVWIFK